MACSENFWVCRGYIVNCLGLYMWVSFLLHAILGIWRERGHETDYCEHNIWSLLETS